MEAQRPERREWPMLLVLSGGWFSRMVDFMMLMPLGTQLMREFDISTALRLGKVGAGVPPSRRIPGKNG